MNDFQHKVRPRMDMLIFTTNNVPASSLPVMYAKKNPWFQLILEIVASAGPTTMGGRWVSFILAETSGFTRIESRVEFWDPDDRAWDSQFAQKRKTCELRHKMQRAISFETDPRGDSPFS